MNSNEKYNTIEIKPFFELLDKLQNSFNISYVEIIFDESDAYVKTKDWCLFIIDLCENDIFVTYEDKKWEWTVLPKSILDRLDKLYLRYVIDDYCTFV